MSVGESTVASGGWGACFCADVPRKTWVQPSEVVRCWCLREGLGRRRVVCGMEDWRGR